MKYGIRLNHLNQNIPILKETLNNLNVFNESKAILCRIEAIVADFSQFTENGTYYGLKLWRNVLTSERMKALIASNSFCLEVDHPDDKSGRLESWFKNTAGVVRKITIDEENQVVRAVIDIINVPAGQMIHTMILAGVQVGFSLRGSGDVDRDGVVNPDTFNLIGIDFVVEPSNVKARITNIVQTSENERIEIPVSEIISTENSIANLLENYKKLDTINNESVNIIKDKYKDYILNSEVEEMKKSLTENFQEILKKKLSENTIPKTEKGQTHTENDDVNDDEKKMEEQMKAIFRSELPTALSPYFSAFFETLNQANEDEKKTESEDDTKDEKKTENNENEDEKKTESEDDSKDEKKTESEDEEKDNMKEMNDFDKDLDKIILGGSDVDKTIGELSIVPDPDTQVGKDIDTVQSADAMDDTIIVEESLSEVEPLDENDGEDDEKKTENNENEDEKKTENNENEDEKKTESDYNDDDTSITERAKFIKNIKYNGKKPENLNVRKESRNKDNNVGNNNNLESALDNGLRW